ncbi:hypothetical protein [Actinomadura sp. WMMA1423]|uniref:hypothetical protein n=1 Tax=Actinomadura sp. WMMA1423 TaxID=2591108 RepID=UPI001147555B|nr:hypothetical protein [Actinomadura sp. WMMA1423]
MKFGLFSLVAGGGVGVGIGALMAALDSAQIVFSGHSGDATDARALAVGAVSGLIAGVIGAVWGIVIGLETQLQRWGLLGFISLVLGLKFLALMGAVHGVPGLTGLFVVGLLSTCCGLLAGAVLGDFANKDASST